jgi:hypothetical protein
MGNVAIWNKEGGIAADIGSTVLGNTAYGNGGRDGVSPFGPGISASLGCLVKGNTMAENQGYGLQIFSGAAYSDNVLNRNETGTVTGDGSNLGGNLCSGAGTVSPSCP